MATTFTITDEKIEQKYSSQELQLKFLSFLRKEWIESSLDLFEVDYEDLSPGAQKAYDNRKNINFIER
jgi:hypothetical protein